MGSWEEVAEVEIEGEDVSRGVAVVVVVVVVDAVALLVDEVVEVIAFKGWI